MKKVIIAPDSFKGTLSSVEVCRTVSEELKNRYGDITITQIPVADGGEGTVDAFLYVLGGEKVYCTVTSPLGRRIEGYYGILPDGKVIIEMAQASGISIEQANNALKSSTYGTGELICHALDKGAKEILIGIGGSATTDAGIGAIAALGGSFLDQNGESISLCGEGLKDIRSIDLSGLDKRLRSCKLTVLCDVKNPLYGPDGAAFVFSPQKGADKKEVRLLDEGLKNIATVTADLLGKDFSLLQGAGAAGGLGFALVAFLGAELKPGIDCVLDVTGFRQKVKECDLVITGEGKIDSQSLMGKVPFGIARASCGKHVIAIAGISHITQQEARKAGIDEIIETNFLHLPFEQIKHKASQMLVAVCEKIVL